MPVFLVMTTLTISVSHLTLAQSDSSNANVYVQNPVVQSEIDALNQTIVQRQTAAAALDGKIAQDQNQINQKESAQLSLQNELDLLNAQMSAAAFGVQATQANIEATNAELVVLGKQARDLRSQMDVQRQLIIALLQKINTNDDGFSLQLLFGSTSVGQLFNEVEALRTVNTDLLQAYKNAQAAQGQIAYVTQQQAQKVISLNQLLVSQAQAKNELQTESISEQQVISQTQYSEDGFDELVSSLKQQQSNITSDADELKDEVSRKLQMQTNAPDMTLIWPVNLPPGFTAAFPDPAYPLANIIPQTGIDIPTPSGTDVHAAAAGYVAWVKQGTDYGTYVMIIHDDGLATLYAHLSKTFVAANDYVAQGDVIARSGENGAGAAKESVLHFEVRADGIPVNPLDYLPKLP